MARKHAVFVSVFLGAAIAAGAFAALRTAHLGQASATTATSKSSLAQLLKRERLLDRQQVALERALAKRPPRLPKLPRFKPQPPAPAAAPAAAPAVRYVRPAPVVVVKHRSGEGEHEHEHEGGDD
jgi:hypothetical protein